MQDLSPQGRQAVEDVARRHGVGPDAAATLLRALAVGGGTQAQFSHPELGGLGQWSQGGMVMVGDMFNQGLKARVDALATELAALLRGQPLFAAAPVAQSQSQSQSGGGGAGVSLFIPGGGASGAWWPSDLGSPASSGAQNETRYAAFPARRRLAISQGGQVTVYDTGEHHITGFSQSQSGDQSLTFTSQHGLVRVADLPVVGPAPSSPPLQAAASPRQEVPPAAPAATPSPAPSPAAPTPAVPSGAPSPAPASPGGPAGDPFAMLERLADLHQKGILTAEEFAAKKAELLSRL